MSKISKHEENLFYYRAVLVMLSVPPGIIFASTFFINLQSHEIAYRIVQADYAKSIIGLVSFLLFCGFIYLVTAGWSKSNKHFRYIALPVGLLALYAIAFFDILSI